MKNNKFCFFLLAFFFMMLCQSVRAQAPFERTNHITSIGGKDYYMHVIKPGQTFEQLAEVYQVTIEEIVHFNPEMKDGLKIGYVIGIPVRLPKVVESETVSEEPKPVVKEPDPVVVEPEPEPVVEEPEPVVEEPAPVVEEPEPEPVIEEPEPIIEEPEPEPVIEEPAPVVEEPEPEPVIEEPEPIIEEPEPEPVIEEPAPIVEEPEPAIEEPKPVVEKPKSEPIDEMNKPNPAAVRTGGRYIVQANENLYDIAKKFGIDLADFKAINPGLGNEPSVGTSILVPDITNVNDYIVHRVEFNERTSSMLKRWKVEEDEFRAMNISVGSHVFVNQVVLIPIDPVKPELLIIEEIAAEEIDEPDTVEPEIPVVEEVEIPQQQVQVEPASSDLPVISFTDPENVPECNADPSNAKRVYKVALMVPLYLNDVSSLEISKANLSNVLKSRSLSFIQFYEGFMMAVEKMTNDEGLKLDLTVIDVTDNVNTAQRALEKLQRQSFDLIVGPFFSKSFAVIEDFAKAHDIMIVNPLSTRENVVENNANVIKVKPSKTGQILDIAHLVRNRYPDANVFILSREKKADSLFLSQLEHELNLAVNEEVSVSDDDFMKFARDESQRREMGSRIVPTVTVEGQVYSTDDLNGNSSDYVVLANPVHRYSYKSGNIHSLITKLSGVRDNVIIAYGDDNVFATQVLNTLKKEADRFPITLVCAPDWTKFEKLLVDNLLQMNAIYLTDNFVDYRSNEAKRFVLDFRRKYAVEPQEYAFEGYDVARYFLTALMRYGDGMMECLPYFSMPMLHTQYHFVRQGAENGLENLNWMMYQYDNEDVELVPVNPFVKATE